MPPTGGIDEIRQRSCFDCAAAPGRPARALTANHGQTAIWAIAVAWLGLAVVARAHPAIDDQLARLAAQIEAAPDNPGLYLRQGDLHRRRGEWHLALAAYERAARCSKKPDAVDLARGQVLLDMERPAEAHAALDRFLATHPDHAGALVARARADAALGRPEAAISSYRRALECMAMPTPDHYLEMARLLASSGREDEAIKTLDDGVTRLGQLVVLYNEAIEVDLKRGRFQPALGRVDRLLARSPARPQWLARRGEILERAGRREEAREAFGKALAALGKRSGRRKRNRAMMELEERVRAGMRRMETGAN